MGLVGKSELLSLNNVVDILILSNGILGASILTCLGGFWEYFGGKTWMVSKEFGCVDL